MNRRSIASVSMMATGVASLAAGGFIAWGAAGSLLFLGVALVVVAVLLGWS